MTLLQLIAAIIAVESGGDLQAYNAAENARGCMQIRPCVIEDVNHFSHTTWTHEDAWEKTPSMAIFLEYTDLWIKRLKYDDTPEVRARIWNGGPYGPARTCTLKYWERIKAKAKEQR